MKTFAALLVCLCAVALLAFSYSRTLRGDGKVMMDTRGVAEFTQVQASGAFEIEWAKGAPGVTVTTDSNLVPHVRTVVEDGTLRIEMENRPYITMEGIKIVLASADLSSVNVLGASHLKAGGIEASEFRVRCSGASTVDLDGKVGQLTAQVNGACTLKAAKLEAKDADISLMGATTADIAVSGSLKTSLSGACTLKYHGSPQSVSKEMTGACTVCQMK